MKRGNCSSTVVVVLSMLKMLEGNSPFLGPKRAPRVWQLPDRLLLHDNELWNCVLGKPLESSIDYLKPLALLLSSLCSSQVLPTLGLGSTTPTDNPTAHHRRKAPRAAIVTGFTQGVKSPTYCSCLASDSGIVLYNEAFGRHQQRTCPDWETYNSP